MQSQPGTELTQEEIQQAIRDARVQKIQKQAREEIDSTLRAANAHPDQARIDPATLFSFTTMLLCALTVILLRRGIREIKAALLSCQTPYVAAPSEPGGSEGH